MISASAWGAFRASATVGEVSECARITPELPLPLANGFLSRLMPSVSRRKQNPNRDYASWDSAQVTLTTQAKAKGRWREDPLSTVTQGRRSP